MLPIHQHICDVASHESWFHYSLIPTFNIFMQLLLQSECLSRSPNIVFNCSSALQCIKCWSTLKGIYIFQSPSPCPSPYIYIYIYIELRLICCRRQQSRRLLSYSRVYITPQDGVGKYTWNSAERFFSSNAYNVFHYNFENSKLIFK